MKISVFTVSMPEYGIEDSVKLLKELGYDGVEWRVGNPPPAEKPENYNFEGRYWSYNQSTLDIEKIVEIAPVVKAMGDKYGIETCALTTYLGPDDLEKIESVMKAANILNCSMIRVNVPNYDGSENYVVLLNKTIEKTKKVEVLAKKYNVKVNFEIHMGNMIPSASAAYRFVSNFDSQYIGIIHDAGNMVYEGFECYKMGIEILGDYLAHVHIKNAKWVLKETTEDGILKWNPTWATIKGGFADLGKLISVLKEAGYDGYLSIEDFSNEKETEAKLKENLEYLKKLLA